MGWYPGGVGYSAEKSEEFLNTIWKKKTGIYLGENRDRPAPESPVFFCKIPLSFKRKRGLKMIFYYPPPVLINGALC